MPSTHCEQRCHGGPSSDHVPRIAHSSGARATPTSHTSLHHLPLAAFSPAQRPVPLTGGSHHVSPCTVPPTSDSPGFLLCFSCRLTMCHRSPRAAAHADSIPPVMLPGLSTSMEQSAFAKHPSHCSSPGQGRHSSHSDPMSLRDTVLVAKRLLHAGDRDRAAGGCCSQGSGLVYPSPMLSAPVPIPSDRPRKRPAGLTASWRFLSLPLEIF